GNAAGAADRPDTTDTGGHRAGAARVGRLYRAARDVARRSPQVEAKVSGPVSPGAAACIRIGHGKPRHMRGDSGAMTVGIERLLDKVFEAPLRDCELAVMREALAEGLAEPLCGRVTEALH